MSTKTIKSCGERGCDECGAAAENADGRYKKRGI
jgi:hypothetical protein